MNEVVVRQMEPGEAQAVSDLAKRTFDAYVGHEFSDEGVVAYTQYIEVAALRERQLADHFVLIALVGDQLAGMIEFRHGEHVSLLFVDAAFHRRGIGRRLYETALARAAKNNPGLERVTVNSSRYAVPVYESLGFAVAGEEQVVNGIIFVPMAAEVSA